MAGISKVFLCATVSAFCLTGRLSYASTDTVKGIPKPGTHTVYTQLYDLADKTHLSHTLRVMGDLSRVASFSSEIATVSLAGLTPSLTLPKVGREYKEASVCFITDTRECSDNKFGNNEDVSGGNGNPGGIPEYDTPQEQCQAAGYGVTSCPAGSHGDNPCPADSTYYQKCVCDANMTQTCTKPYYGVGPSCDGKYASCEKDTPRVCKEDGYGQSGACPDLQTPNKKCPYDSAYYDKCVCRSDLVSCTYPQTGVGTSCDGKYESCQCPSSYKSCECGGAAGATSCTLNGQTTYSSCKECCASSYKYTCAGSHQKPNGTACGGKYKSCSCDSGYEWSGGACVRDCGYGYEWNGSSCVCVPDYYPYSCSGRYESGYGSSCNGKYSSCECSDGYSWNDTNGCYCPNSCTLSVCPEHASCRKEECSGKYCFSYCDSGYIYNETTQKCEYECKKGSIYYSDGTCSSPYKPVESGKTAWGYILNQGNYGEWSIVAMEYASSGEEWGPVGFNTMDCDGGNGNWCTGNHYLSIAGQSSTNCTTCYQRNGIDNFPAARAAVNYAPAGASETRGYWKLPGTTHCEYMDDTYGTGFWLALAYGGDMDKAWICTAKYGKYSASDVSRTSLRPVLPVLNFVVSGCNSGSRTRCPVKYYK